MTSTVCKLFVLLLFLTTTAACSQLQVETLPVIGLFINREEFGLVI